MLKVGGAAAYSTGYIQYHWRYRVSRAGSGRDRVVPRRRGSRPPCVVVA